jgi:membrane dipeptidase
MTTDAAALHRSSIVIEGVTFFCRGWSDRLERAGLTAMNITSAWPDDDLEHAVSRIEDYYATIGQDPKLGLVLTAGDIERFKREARAGIILGFQNTRCIGTDLVRAETFHRLGVRVMQLTYNEQNFVGCGVMEPRDSGLSLFGRDLVRELNRLGVVIDLSHGGYRTTMEAIDRSEAPVIFSHSNPAARVDVPRNIKDDQIKSVAAKGGVIGCSSYPPLNWRGGPPPKLSDFIDNIDYVVNLVGADHVGIGTDSEATKGAYPPELRAMLRRKYSGTTGGFSKAFPQGAPLEGLEEGLGDWPNITAALVARGYPAVDVQKIIGGNFLRVFRAVWGG